MARCLVIGSNGFIGRHICTALVSKGYIVGAADRTKSSALYVDLLNEATIQNVIARFRPDYIINAAGIVENNNKANLNPILTKNLLSVVAKMQDKPKRIVIMGSASEYGEIDDYNRAIPEEASLNPTSPYSISKMKETKIAERFHKSEDMDIIVARVFNPIGNGMGPRFLVSNILKQLFENSPNIIISRLDTMRDYIDVRDVANAVVSFVEKKSSNHHLVQNIGSGKPTSNGELLGLILSKLNLKELPVIIESLDKPEKIYAAKADIRRIKKEFGWQPRLTLDESITEIVNEAKNKS
jgi:nucleoside-diphosphate-sugar epimerase